MGLGIPPLEIKTPLEANPLFFRGNGGTQGVCASVNPDGISSLSLSSEINLRYESLILASGTRGLSIDIHIYIYIYIYIHTSIHTYIYIYIARERERERERYCDLCIGQRSMAQAVRLTGARACYYRYYTSTINLI